MKRGALQLKCRKKMMASSVMSDRSKSCSNLSSFKDRSHQDIKTSSMRYKTGSCLEFRPKDYSFNNSSWILPPKRSIWTDLFTAFHQNKFN